MCLIVLAWKSHPDFPLIVAANRDEFHARPTMAARFWEDRPEILAGRDLEGMGTWLGVTRRGRFAAVTNYREAAPAPRDAASRGVLASRFLG
ncbi:MAG: NRDE family protein, partial [Burkholderiales bacterium]